MEEKEAGLRQLLLAMGLRPWLLTASWAATYLALLLAAAAVCVAVCTSSFLATTSPTLLFAFFAAFAVSEVAFGALVAALFGSAKAAAVVGPLAHFAAMMPRYVFVKTGAPPAPAALRCAACAALLRSACCCLPELLV